MQEIWKKFFSKNNLCLLLQFSMMAIEGFEVWKMIFILYTWKNGFVISSDILQRPTWTPTRVRRRTKRVLSSTPNGTHRKRRSNTRPPLRWISSGSRMMAPATIALPAVRFAFTRRNSVFPNWCRCSASLTKWWLHFSTACFTESRRWQTVANTAITS